MNNNDKKANEILIICREIFLTYSSTNYYISILLKFFLWNNNSLWIKKEIFNNHFLLEYLKDFQKPWYIPQICSFETVYIISVLNYEQIARIIQR